MLKDVELLPDFCSDHGISDDSLTQKMWNKINEIITSLQNEHNNEQTQKVTKLSENCGTCESRRYSKERNEQFLNFVCSSWHMHYMFDIIRIFLNQETTSKMIRVGRSEDVKKYIEAVTHSHIEIEVHNSMDIVIKINMDYSLLSESEHIKLRKGIQKYDLTKILKLKYNDIK